MADDYTLLNIKRDTHTTLKILSALLNQSMASIIAELVQQKAEQAGVNLPTPPAEYEGEGVA